MEIVRGTWLSRPPHPGAGWVVGISTLVLSFGASLYWREPLAHGFMPASFDLVFHQHQTWRLWTTLFAHGDLGHLLANSFLFMGLGYFLTGYFSWHLFPVLALVTGGLTNALVLWTYPEQTLLIGASGVVSWMGGAWLMLYFLIARHKSWGQRAIRACGVAVLLFMPMEAFDPQISYRTHVVGFCLGVLCGGIYFLGRRVEFQKAEVVEVEVEEAEIDEADFNTQLLDESP